MLDLSRLDLVILDLVILDLDLNLVILGLFRLDR
jgi:hypothetical protein